MRQRIMLMLLVLLLGVSFQTLGGPMPGQEAAAAPAPWLRMSPAREVPTVFKGSDRAVASLEARQAEPLSLASGDFDEDGVPDVVSGYKFGRGGIIGLRRGNVDAIYPNAPEARERRRNGTFVDAPFLPETRLFETPQRPDFLGAGDFDADGHLDVVAANRAGTSLQWHRGDGQGGFGPAQTVAISGRPTALTTGEINRRDGLADVVVAVEGPAGPEALVFESPEGALKGSPERLGLSAPATSLLLGQMDEDYAYDLLMAAGDKLMLVQGRDRKLSLDPSRHDTVAAARIARMRLPFQVASVALGDFDADRVLDAALLATSGTLYVTPMRSLIEPTGSEEVTEESLGAPLEPQSAEATLLKVNASGLPGDDLLVIDRGARRLQGVLAPRRSGKEQSVQRTARVWDEGEPVAVLPMRLNSDARDDLIVLADEQPALSVITPLDSPPIMVTNVSDSGPGSLRQALLDANAAAGADIINFNILGPGPHTIVPALPLPDITDSVIIDGTTEPSFAGTPVVELDGTDIWIFAVDMFTIYAPNTTVRGLVIRNFHNPDPTHSCEGGAAIALYPGSDGSIIEGNFLGTNATGLAAAYDDDGITIGSSNNRIGGTVATARNLINADCRGVALFDGADGTVVQGNLIGTNLSGDATFTDSGGVGMGFGSDNTTIGGTAAGARNVIAIGRAFAPGVSIRNPGTSGHLVQGNYIGTNAAGTSLLGLGGQVNINDSADNNTIGGTSPTARNVIGAPGSDSLPGVWVDSGATGTLIQGNFIGTNAAGSAALGSGGDGVEIGDASNNAVGGSVAGARNVISGRRRHGVEIRRNLTDASGNVVAGNYIGTDTTGSSAIPNNGDGVHLFEALDTTVGGATLDARNVISGNAGSGVRIEGGGAHFVRGNYLGTNAAGTAAIPNLGDGAIVIQSSFNQIGGLMPGEGNLISGNTLAGLEISGGTATANFVRGNKIGTDATGALSLGNGVDGIRLSGPTRDGRIESNVIAFNGGGGILAFGTLNNLFVSNSIFSNAALGIDLEGDGVTINDPGDPDTGSNGLQNFPVLSSVTTTGSIVVLHGSLDTLNPETYLLEFFKSPSCDPSGHGEGRTFLGSRSIDAGITSPTPFDTFVPGSVAAGEVVTATASSAGLGTSEFSACFAVGGTAPGAVDGMRFDTAVPQTLAWDAEPGASLYHLYVGTAATQSGLVTPASDACEAAALPETGGTLPPGSNPPPGQMIWFLVTAANEFGEGPLQPASSGPRILNSTGPCGDSCAHSNCSAGGPLDPACSLCTGIICAKDPHCCDPQNGSWDLSCVQQMRTVCRSLTCGESEGQCAHSLCDTDGGPLSPGCDMPPLPVSCTAAVCQVDPHCCQQAWDEACITRMETVCGYSCI